MNTRRLIALSAICAAALGATTAIATGPIPPPPATGATPHRVDVPIRSSSYAAFDARGRRVGAATWRISAAGGNCCETYVNGTPSGRIVESGGTYPWYTDDEGKHWFEVTFDVPDQNDNGPAIAGGEGATVVGPGGDVYGVTWDAYSGDHLQAYRYDAQKRAWNVAEVVLKTPIYDRPWLTFAQGPFVIGGTKTNRLLDVIGGTLTKDVETLSTDGLDYSTPSDPLLEEQGDAPVRFRIPVVRNAAADWWQPHPGTHTVPLSGGGVLHFPTPPIDDELPQTVTPCPLARLTPSDGTWQCVTGPRLKGVVRQDSRGVLTEVYPTTDGSALQLATSRDGGRHWRSTLLRPPAGAGVRLEARDMYDVVANGRLRQAVVSARFEDAKGYSHDMVFRVSTRHERPKLLRTYLVGKGDVKTGNDVSGSAGYRFDYESVALLPNGHIAVTFLDSTCVQPSLRDSTRRSPEVAILIT